MWIEVEATELPDKRLKKRLGQMVEQLSESPHRSLPQVFGRWNETKSVF
jgi:hypothetical protein